MRSLLTRGAPTASSGGRSAWIRISRLRGYCRDAGLGEFRRFFEGTRPYERRGREFLWQLVRLAAANTWVAPQASIWVAARRPPPPAA